MYSHRDRQYNQSNVQYGAAQLLGTWSSSHIRNFFSRFIFRTLCQNLSNLNVKPNMFTPEVACEDTLKVERTMEDASLFL